MIQSLAKNIEEKSGELQRWYQQHLAELSGTPPPIYTSVDLRNSGFKIGVVDTNLFPAGFNNLCETFSEKASETFRAYFKKWYPEAQKVLIFPEEHTRNLFYWKNVAAIQRILKDAGKSVIVGSASTLFSYPHQIELEDGESVTIEKFYLEGDSLRTENFVPDLILINNDLSTGTPDYLTNLAQPLAPCPHMGWYRRKKSEHFAIYQNLINEVAQILSIDPWLLSPMTTVETGIDLQDEICLKRLQESADGLLARVQQKYLEHGIDREPYLFVKNNSGTYGMGVTHVGSGSELLQINRRLRNKLQSAKGGSKVSEYLLQEGIPTADFYKGKALEPMVYLVGGEAVGTFFRINEGKSEMESLNAPGMEFACLCLHKVSHKKTYQLTYENKDDLFTVASLLGKVASLAAMLESENILKMLDKVG